MSEEFKGRIPNIKIVTGDNQFFTYHCMDVFRMLSTACTYGLYTNSEKCFDCIGFNKRFNKYFYSNRRCMCGNSVDFGYFILIFHLGIANLLPDDFKITCCHCHKEKEQKPKVISEDNMAWVWGEL